MNSSNFRFTLDLHSAQSQYSIPAMVGDTGITLHISLTDGGVPYVIKDGCLAKLSIKRPTGTYIEEFCTIRNNAIVEYPFRQNVNTCAVAGIHHCDVTLYGTDGAIVGGPRFTMVVSEKVVRSDDIELTDDTRTAVDQIITIEANRVLAEEARVAAEEGRVLAENARVEADAERIKATAEDAGRAEKAATIAVEAAVNIEKFERRLENVESGVITGFYTDDTTAYQKTVPMSALKYAELEKSGVNTGRYTTSNFYTGDRDVVLSAPYEVGVKKELCRVILPAGVYYINWWGSFNGYMTDESTARIMINDIESKYVTLDTAQMVTVYAVMYVDYSSNGSEFMSHTFSDVGIFAVSYDGEWFDYSRYEEPSGADVITAPLTAIVSNGKTYPIPEKYIELQESMKSGEGGHGSDYIDWANGKLVKCMKGVDAGTLTWRKSSGRFQATISDMKNVSASDAKIGVLFEGYQYLGTGTSVLTEGGMATNKLILYVQDNSYATKDEFTAAMSGKMLYYEVAENPETIDIDTSDFDRFIEVKPGGTIRFMNANNAVIPSTITYQLKEG